MSNWVIILLCILSYMLLVTINNIIKDFSRSDEVSIGDIILGGIFTWSLMFATMTIRKIKKLIKKIKYKSLIQDKDGNIYWCNFKDVEDILETTDFNFANCELFVEDMKHWKLSFCLNKTSPNVRYAPKQVWKRYKKYRGSK